MSHQLGKDFGPSGSMPPSAPPSRPASRPGSKAPTLRRKPRRRAISVVSMDQGSVKLAYTESRISLEDMGDGTSGPARDMNGGVLTLDPADPQASVNIRNAELNDALHELERINRVNRSGQGQQGSDSKLNSGYGTPINNTRSRRESSISSKFRGTIERVSLEWNDFTTKFGKRNLGHQLDYSSRIAHSAGDSVTHCNPTEYFLNLFPFLTWIRFYSIKDNLVNDIIVGFTVGVLHIPQGLAYGMLAQVEPINGLYVSFFPVLVYSFMATSRHNSIGTSAVVSIMLHNAVEKLHDINDVACFNETLIGPLQDYDLSGGEMSHIGQVNCVTNLEVVTTMCLITGILMLGMGLLHLGSLSLVLSDQLVSAFVCGSAFHVATSQLGNFFGLKLDGGNGICQLVYIWIDLFRKIQDVKLPTLIVSLVSFVALVVCKEIGEPRIKSRFKFMRKLPIPTDLIAIIVATLISYLMQLGPKYQLHIMKTIPTGLKEPVAPRMDIAGKFLPDCIAIAIVSFTVCASLGKIYAKEHKYKVVPNQELIAMGAANIFSAFFACFPCSSSLSRSAVQSIAGGKTHIASLVSCLLLLIVLLFLAPLLYHLPKCILAVVTLVALKSLLMQTKEVFTYWKMSRLEALTWAVTFLGVILLDIDIGLLLGESCDDLHLVSANLVLMSQELCFPSSWS